MVTHWLWVREGKARDDSQVSGLATAVTSLRYGVNPGLLTAGRDPDRLHAVAGAERGRGHGTLAAPSSPPSPCLLTHLSAPGTEGQVPQGRGLAAREPGPLTLNPPRLRAAPSLGSTGGGGYMHLAGPRRKGDTHQIQ